MILFQTTAQFPSGVNPCNMPASASPIWAWAPGGEPLDMPLAAGFRVGAGAATYAVIQMHYSNPSNTPGYRDSSGARLYLTTSLRPNNAGFMFLGMNTGRIFIPKDHARWHQTGSCPTSATNALGTNVMNVFASGLHMHLHGKEMWTEHFRGSTQLPRLGETHTYDFNAQKFVPVNATIRAGDSLTTHCIWDSVGSPTNITGGESTYEEMCLNVILYYPTVASSSCQIQNTNGCDYGTLGCT
jgi:hypothetical protein